MRVINRSIVVGLSLVTAALAGTARAGAPCLEDFARLGLPGYPNGEVKAMAVFNDGTGEALYIGGLFQDIDGQQCRSHLAKSFAGTFVPVGENSNASPFVATINALAAGPLPGGGQGLFVGGVFSHIGTTPTSNNLAVYLGDETWFTIPGAFGGGSGQGIKSLAAIDPPGLKEEALLVVAGDFTTVDGTPTPGLAQWDGFGSLAPLPGPPAGNQLVSLQGVKAIDLDGSGGPLAPVIAIFGAARTSPPLATTSAVRVFDGNQIFELGPTGSDASPFWLRGTVRDITEGDPDGSGPLPWTIYAVGSNLLGGGEQLAAYDASVNQWFGITTSFFGNGSAPTILDSVTAVPLDPPNALALISSSKFASGRLFGHFFDENGTNFGFTDVSGVIGQVSIVRHFPQVTNPSTFGVIAGGSFAPPVQLEPSTEGYNPYGVRNVAQIPLESPFINPILPVQANAAQVPPLPTAEFAVPEGLWTLSTFDSDGTGPLPRRLLAHPRNGTAFNPAATIGSQQVTGAIYSWDGSAWTAIPGAFTSSEFGESEIYDLVEHDPDGPSGPIAPQLVAAGEFDNIDGSPARDIASFNGVTWTPLTNSGLPMGPSVRGAISGEVTNIFPGQNSLFVFGQLTTNGMVGGPATSGVAVRIGTEWWYLTDLNLGAGTVRALAINDPDGSGPLPSKLYAANEFVTLVWEGGGPVVGPVITGSWDPIVPGLGNGTQGMTNWAPDGGSFLPNFLVFFGQFGFQDSSGNPARLVLYDAGSGNRFSLDGFPWGTATNAVVLPPVGSEDNSRLAIAGFGTSPSVVPPSASGVAIASGPSEAGWNVVATAQTPNDFPMVVIDDDATGPNTQSLIISTIQLGAGFATNPPSAQQGLAQLELVSPGFWISSGGGQITDSAMYNCSRLPGPADLLTFDNSTFSPGLDTRTVTLPSNFTVAGIRALADRTTIDLAGNTLVMSPADPASQPGLLVGDGPTDSTYLGFTSSSTFSFVDTVFGKVIIAARDVGSFVDQRLYVGSNTQFNSDSIDVGVAGRGGHLEVNSQTPGQIATMGVFAGLRVGIQPGSQGAVTVQGIPGATQASINPQGAGPTHIGVAGNGFMAIYPGGRFIGAATDFAVAVQPGSTGFVLQDNANNLVILSSPTFSIGRGGLGGYEVTGGANANLNDGNIILGELSTGTGTLTVRDTGSTLNHSGGSVTVGADGAGDLRVLNSGEFITSGTVNVGPRGAIRGNGAVRATGGIINNGSISPASTLDIPGEDVPGSIGTLTIDGQLTQNSAGTTTIDLSSPPGGFVTSDNLFVTGQATFAGRLDVRLTPGSFIPDGALSSGQGIFASSNLPAGAFDVATFPGLTPDFLSGRGRFLRYEFRPVPARGGLFEIAIIEDTLDAIIEAAPPSNYTINGAGTAAALGDLDNDGDQDLVITVPNSADPVGTNGSIIILFNAGTLNGYWQGFSSTTQILVRRNPSGVALGDFDDAAGLDIAVVHATDGDLVVLTNDGSGGFGPIARGLIAPIPVGIDPNAVDARDFNGDGRIDAVVSVAGDLALRVFYNAGGTGEDWTGFDDEAETILTAGSPAGTTTGDLDDDKFDDITSPNPKSGTIDNSANRGVIAAGRGIPDQFADPVSIFVGGQPVDIAAGDLNLDGFLDLVVAIRSGAPSPLARGSISLPNLPPEGALAILLGNGTFEMTPPIYIAAGTNPSSVALARLDPDNDPDIAVVTTNELDQRVVRVIRNDLFGGNLNFAFQADLFPGSAPVLVLSSDVTGDQADDLVTINTGGAVNTRGSVPGDEDVSVFTFDSCRGDADNDRTVGMGDILAVLANWQNNYSPSTGPGDADGNGTVEFNDITAVLGFYGRICTN